MVNQIPRRRLVVVEVDFHNYGNNAALVRLANFAVARAVERVHPAPHGVRERDRHRADGVQLFRDCRRQRLRARTVGVVEGLRAAVPSLIGVVVERDVIVGAQRGGFLGAALVVAAVGVYGGVIDRCAVVGGQPVLHKPCKLFALRLFVVAGYAVGVVMIRRREIEFDSGCCGHRIFLSQIDEVRTPIQA